MKRSLIEKIPFDLPNSILPFTENAKIYDSSSSPEAKVYFIDKGEGYYLKISPKKSLENEAVMTEFFFKKGIGAEVINYISENQDFLLTGRVKGEDATHEKFISEPKKLCDKMAEYLRMLHEINTSGCPVADRNESYLALADKNYTKGIYDLSLTEKIFTFKSADEAFAVLKNGKAEFRNNVLLHGDYCLPNVMLKDSFELSGFIDVGNGGIGDRHIDVFWGTWTLWFNLKTDKYRSRFIDAYGRDKINEEMLRVIAAAEVFG